MTVHPLLMRTELVIRVIRSLRVRGDAQIMLSMSSIISGGMHVRLLRIFVGIMGESIMQ